MKWKDSIRELFIVTLGVLIAFGLNSWNDTRKEKRMADHYLEAIVEEMKINVEELEEKVPYHQDLLHQLRTDPENANMVLNPSKLSNISWKLAENNIFKEHIDPKLYRELAKCYQIHDYLNMQAQEAGTRMSEINIMGPFYRMSATNQNPTEEEMKEFGLDMARGWVSIFETWTYLEERYLNSLKGLIATLE
ncbi:MAG: hypothetical protein AAFO82_11160 [Bacteroidota bacterium]